MNNSSLRSLSITLLAILLFPVASFTQDQSTDKKTEAPEVLERFKVHRHGDALLVPVTFKGKEYQFLVDTGATFTFFDQSLPLGPVKQTVQVESADGPATVSIFAGQEFKVGKLAFDWGKFSVGADLTKMRETSGYPVHGMIGMDFLGKHVMQIDFDEGELLFLKMADPKVGTAFRLVFTELELPGVVAKVHEKPNIRFVIDTGYVGQVNLAKGPLTELEKKKELRFVSQTLSTTLKGISSHRVAQGRQLSLGEFTIANPVFTEGRHNLLGSRFLSRFKATFDFPERKLYLEKGKRFAEPDVWDLSGLHVLRKQGKTLVDSVDKGSPAATAGVRAKDLILKVGDGKVEEMPLFELRRLCCQRGSTLNLTIERQQQIMDVKVELKTP